MDTTLDSAGLEAFLGVEVSTGTPVVLMLISAAEATVLEKAKQVEHAHLGRLLDVVTLDDGRHVAVAARIDGETLEERVRASGKKEPVAAVRMALRVAEALHALHDAGATHGFVHARSVVVEPYGREPPVLAYAPATGTEPWNAPEHTPGAPTPSDDSWAAASLLHLMLTGRRPPLDGYANETELEGAGVSDPVLQATLLHALARSPDGPRQSARPSPRARALVRGSRGRGAARPRTPYGSSASAGDTPAPGRRPLAPFSRRADGAWWSS